MEKTVFTILLMMGLRGVTALLVREHFFVKTPMRWITALKHCRKHYTDLSSVLTEDDVDRIFDAGGKRSATKGWIGLIRSQHSYHNGSSWKWSKNHTIDIQKWGGGQPNNNYHLHNRSYRYNCVYMKDRHWYNFRCRNSLPFFCFRQYDRVLTLVQENMMWEEALDYCRENHTDLASVVSENSALQFVNSSAEGQTEFVWMGLRFLAGHWLWVNRDKLQFSGWHDTNQYRCPAIPYRCGALSMKDIVWEPKHCEEKLKFICYTEKRRSG